MSDTRRRPRDYPRPVKHQNDQGKPAFDRGKRPHEGGYHGRKKGVNALRVGFYVSDGVFDIVSGGHRVKTQSDWSAGKKRKTNG